MSRMITLENYVGKMSTLKFQFRDPVKQANQTYVADLKTPITFMVPKSEISSIFENDQDQLVVSYSVDGDDSFLTAMEELDTYCVSLACQHSQAWFGKKCDRETLERYYNTIIQVEESEDDDTDDTQTGKEDEEDSEEDEDADEEEDMDEDSSGEPVIYFHLPNDGLIEDLREYNDVDSLRLVISLDGIQFYKKLFQWKLSVHQLVHDSIVSKKAVPAPTPAPSPVVPVPHVLDDDVISSLAKDCPPAYYRGVSSFPSSSVSVSASSSSAVDTKSQSIQSLQSTHSKLSKSSKIELQSRLTEKRLELRTHLLNVERAKRSIETQKKKAEELSREIHELESVLRLSS